MFNIMQNTVSRCMFTYQHRTRILGFEIEMEIEKSAHSIALESLFFEYNNGQ